MKARPVSVYIASIHLEYIVYLHVGILGRAFHGRISPFMSPCEMRLGCVDQKNTRMHSVPGLSSTAHANSRQFTLIHARTSERCPLGLQLTLIHARSRALTPCSWDYEYMYKPTTCIEPGKLHTTSDYIT